MVEEAIKSVGKNPQETEVHPPLAFADNQINPSSEPLSRHSPALISDHSEKGTVALQREAATSRASFSISMSMNRRTHPHDQVADDSITCTGLWESGAVVSPWKNLQGMRIKRGVSAG
jgi:hypothetical protein